MRRDRRIPCAITWSCCLLLLFASQLAAQGLPTAQPEDVGVSSEKVGELSKFMQSLVDQGKIAGGVTMMARNGKVIHLKAVGMMDRESKKPMQTDAIFRIASMTKPITSVAVMMLWEDGKLGLDDPVSKYIPEFKNPQVLVSVNPWKTIPAKREITIRHLLTHTSGLGYPNTEKIGPLYLAKNIPYGTIVETESLEEIMKRLAKIPLLFHPGENWQYSMSTDVLGRVVEVASDMPLDRYFCDKVFESLGMKNTFFKVPAEKKQRLVSAYIPVGAEIRKLEDGDVVDQGQPAKPICADYPYVDSHQYLSGGGGLCSTPADYMRFCQMLLNEGELNGLRLLKEDTVRMMTANHIRDFVIPWLPEKFGLGFAVYPDTTDVCEQLRNAYAWFGFWSTSFRVSPRGDWILITMSQVAWNDETPAWFSEFETTAAEAIQE
ncbi:MAG: serine hydrolase domain-containing protein [Planctomycetota bacterium]|jgi:CubicO group peptidase (beta-lactamase class C family)